MKVSIVIPTKNGGSRYNEVLNSLFENTIDGGFEVIVIDSGSSDGTCSISRRYPTKLYQIRPDEFGHGRVRNHGARLAKGEYLVYLTQDAIPASSTWLRMITDALTKDPSVAGVYSRQLPDGNNPMEAFFLNRVYNDIRVIRSLNPGHGSDVTLNDIFFSNVGSAIRRSVWEQYPFSDTINMSEDQEWAKKVLLAGYKTVYEPTAAVHHSHDYTLMTIFRRNYESGFSLKGISHERFWPTLKSTISYLRDESSYLIKKCGYKKLPAMLSYEFVRYTGFAAGNIAAGLKKQEHAKWIPRERA